MSRSSAFERSYAAALGRHVKLAKSAGGGGRVGQRAQRLGIETLALARIHDRAAAALSPSSASPGREATFFAEAVAPTRNDRVGNAHADTAEAVAGTARLEASLVRRTGELADVRARLLREVAQRRTLEVAATADARTHATLAARAQAMERRLRSLSRRLLSAQEEERRQISRDLHDAIGRTLTGINVGLASLKRGAAANSRDVAEAITLTQRLVERSMKTVHQFAWELRPTILDDLGLVPAVRSYARLFAARTGIPVAFTAGARLRELDGDRSVALFRVAQGALSNIERHAHAARARVVVRALRGVVRLEVSDDGHAFDAPRMEASKTEKHFGLIVMRERVEMVGGTFSITSSPNRGTTVRADVPIGKEGGSP